MSHARRVVAIAAAAGLTACATAKVQSVVDHTRAGRIEELSILARARDPEVAEHLAENLAKRLTAIGVANDYRVLPASNEGALRLEQDDEPGAAARMLNDAPHARVLLAQVTFVRGVHGMFGSMAPDQLETTFAIYPRGDGRAVWKSQVQVSFAVGQAGLGSESLLLNKVAESVIAQLRTDGLLPESPAASPTEETAVRAY
jgi:hypothetical protein